MNIFDTLKAKTHATITNFFGYDAVWVSSVSGITHKARVGYKDPSEKEYLAGLEDFEPDTPYMDYFVTSFPGLKAAVDASKPEYVTIYDKDVSGVVFIKGYFTIMKVLTKSDGDTYIAKMQAETLPTP